MLPYMQYNYPYLHSTKFTNQGYPLKIYLEKHNIDTSNRDNYYLKLYLVLPTGKEILIGYLYFFLHFELKLSRFVGIYIDPNYRDQGLASLLLASWIELSLQNDLTNLSINRKQRKPFFLYLLKKFSFEIDDISYYETSDSVIYICQKGNSRKKVLCFRNKAQEQTFLRSHIFQNDNYEIAASTSDVTVLDQVVLNKRYNLQDNMKGYQKCQAIFERHKR